MTPEEISEKIIKKKQRRKQWSGCFRYHSAGDCYKEKAEAVNKLLKDTCTKKKCILFDIVTLMLSDT